MNLDIVTIIRDILRRVENLENNESSPLIQQMLETTETDGNGDIQPNEPDRLLEYDANGDLVPIEGTSTDTNFELDGNGDIEPK